MTESDSSADPAGEELPDIDWVIHDSVPNGQGMPTFPSSPPAEPPTQE